MNTSDTDMELLKAAAEAVAYYHDGFDSDLGHDVWWLQDQSRFGAWNPLTDDGDAMRLLVRLRLKLSWPDLAEVHADTDWDNVHVEEPITDGDLQSATRRAVVRAAAELGKKRQ